MSRQLSLFENEIRPGAVRRAAEITAAPVPPEVLDLARRLPAGIRLGASSWHFPGWHGSVWGNTVPPGDLARHGLAVYAQHPLFRAVGIDRAFHAPLSAWQYEAHARQVPDDFRFLVKAPGILTSAWVHGDHATKSAPNAQFLDVDYAIEQFIRPATEGLGAKAGILLFQFSPLGRTLTRAPERFVAQLHDFLERLPKGPRYAVEMRDARIITRRFFASLRDTGVHYSVGIHPRMPPVAAQAAAMSGFGAAPLLVRWNLRAGYGHDDAERRFAPFDRLIEEDSATRESIARLCVATLAAGQECTVIANNKAEGSAPLTLIKLAQAIVAAMRRSENS